MPFTVDPEEFLASEETAAPRSKFSVSPEDFLAPAAPKLRVSPEEFLSAPDVAPPSKSQPVPGMEKLGGIPPGPPPVTLNGKPVIHPVNPGSLTPGSRSTIAPLPEKSAEKLLEGQSRFGGGKPGASPGQPTFGEIGQLAVIPAAEGVALAASTVESAAARQSLRALSGALSGYFAYQGAKGAAEQSNEAYKSFRKGDYFGSARNLGAAGISAFFAWLGARQARGDYQAVADIAKVRNALQQRLNVDTAAGKMAETGPKRLGSAPEAEAPAPGEIPIVDKSGERMPVFGEEPSVEAPAEPKAEPPAVPPTVIQSAPAGVTIEPGATYQTYLGPVSVTKVDGDRVTYDWTDNDGTEHKGISSPVSLFQRKLLSPAPPPPQDEVPVEPDASAPPAAEQPQTPPPSAIAPEEPGQVPANIPSIEPQALPPVPPQSAPPEQALAPAPEVEPVKPELAPEQNAPQSDPTPGSSAEIFTIKGRKVNVRYEVRSADDLVNSFQPNYPQEYQPRQTDRAASAQRIAQRENDMEFALMADSRLASDGAPIILGDGTIVTRNHGTEALKRLYAAKKPLGDKYRQDLIDHAHEYGKDPAQVAAIPHPVLTRVITDAMEPSDIVAFAQEANMSSAARMSDAEVASALAKRMAGPLMDSFDPGEDGRPNAEFVRELIKDLPVEEQGVFMDKNGQISQTGSRIIRNAIFAKAYPDPRGLERMAESENASLKNITNGMLAAAPKVAQLQEAVARGDRFDLSIGQEIADAATVLDGLVRSKTTIADWKAQGDMFGRDPVVSALVDIFAENRRSSKRLAEFLKEYTEVANDAGSPKQETMFGPPEAPNKAEIIAIAYERAKAKREAGKDAFGDEESPASPSGSGVAKGKGKAAGSDESAAPFQARKLGASLPGDQPLFTPETEAEVNAQQKHYDDKLLHDQLTAQFASGTAVKPSKLKPAETRNMFEDEGPEQGGLFSRQMPGTFSQLERTIEQKMGNSASPAQLLAMLRNPQSGVKPDELKWTGLDTFLAEHKGPVTKQQVMDFVKANEVRVEEVEKGERQGIPEGAPPGWTSVGTNPSLGNTKFSQYVTPGGENYRELLLTLPPKPVKVTWKQTEPDTWVSTGGDTLTGEHGRFEIYDLTKRGKGFQAYDSVYRHTRTFPTLEEAQAQLERGRTSELTEGDQYKSPHWDESNVLAHIRFDDRTGPNGERLLHIAEIQSDWHQAGKKKGYRAPVSEDFARDYFGIDQSKWDSQISQTDRNAYVQEATERSQHDKPQAAPFAKTWPEIAFRRMLRYASENGYDQLTWDRGEVQAERYNLSKRISRIEYEPEEKLLRAYDLEGNDVLMRGDVAPEKLEDYIGKEAAKNLLASPLKGVDKNLPKDWPLEENVGLHGMRHVRFQHARIGELGNGTFVAQLRPGESYRDAAERRWKNYLTEKQGGRSTPWHELTGDGLKVGGEGMKGFYDKILPEYANKLGKKWGAKVEKTTIAGSGDVSRPLYVTNETDGFYVEGGGFRQGPFGTEQDALKIKNEADKSAAASRVAVHSITITPAMRDSVMQGQPLFARRHAPDPNQLSLFEERSTSAEQVAKPRSPDAPTFARKAVQFDPASVKRIREPGVPQEPATLGQVRNYWNGAEVTPKTIGGHRVIFVNQPAMDVILRRMGPLGQGATHSHTLGVLLQPGEWANIITEARVAEKNPRAGGFDDALAYIGKKITGYMGEPKEAAPSRTTTLVNAMNAAPPSTERPLIVAQAGNHIPDHVLKRIVEEEIDHALQTQLPGGLHGLPVGIFSTAGGQKATAALVRAGYKNPNPASPFFEHNRAIMVAEIGVRLMRPGRWRELDMTVQEAGDLAEAFVTGLAKHGDKAHTIVEQIYGAIPKAANPNDAPRSGGIQGQHAPVSERGPPRPAEAEPKTGEDVSRVGAEASGVTGSKGVSLPDFELRGPQPIVKPPASGESESRIVLQSRKPVNEFLKSEEGTSAVGPLAKSVAKDLLQAVAKVDAAAGAAKDDILKLFAPAARKGAEPMAMSLRKRAAEMARVIARADRAMEDSRTMLDKLPVAQRWAFYDRAERGLPEPNQELQQIANIFRRILDSDLADVQKLGTGQLENFIQNYLPHIYKDPERAENVFASYYSKRLAEGSKAFLRQRKFPFLSDAMQAGLEPISENPVDLIAAKHREVQRYVMAHRALNDAMARGTPQYIRSGRGPEGYAPLDDKLATVFGPRQGAVSLPAGANISPDDVTVHGQRTMGRYWFPEAEARLFNNYLSPGLAGSSVFRGYRALANTMNQFQLGFSAFHLGFTTFDAATSKLALGIYQAAHGHPVQGLISAAQAPIAPFTGIIKGDKMLREYFKPGSQGAEIADLVDAMIVGGGRAQMDTFYRNNTTQKMMDAFRAALDPSRTAFERAAKAMGGVLRIPASIVENTSKPIMEWIVPRQKMAVFADLAAFELSRLKPGEDPAPALARAWNSVDNRMGQMVYDNRFWDKMFKDMLMASVRSVGWNTGTIGEIVGGVADIRKLASRSPDVTPKLSYIIALPIMAVGVGSVIYYLWHGKGPDKLEETINIPDSKGNKYWLPSYMKDIESVSAEGVTKVAKGKIHPMLSLLGDMLSNKDFFDRPIVRTDPSNPFTDRLLQGLTQEADFLSQQFLPMSIRPPAGRAGKSPRNFQEKALPFFGITRVPSGVLDPNKARHSYHPANERSPYGK